MIFLFDKNVLQGQQLGAIQRLKAKADGNGWGISFAPVTLVEVLSHFTEREKGDFRIYRSLVKKIDILSGRRCEPEEESVMARALGVKYVGKDLRFLSAALKIVL